MSIIFSPRLRQTLAGLVLWATGASCLLLMGCDLSGADYS
jgi:hypothetical protein